ncbi:hypothetical protein CC78DRAFT_617150 [Lojkania enalia]|uniref:Gpi anchored protein n=1 Tax=Lojkania enalia TaxID=147567 RepID=A0A9P4K7C8_9PLEO|nr:hypothetical protein CC78DRAFT_617150 [Didymosphaeria enalia]
MSLFQLTNVCFFLLAGYLGSEVSAELRHVGPSDRVLRAATRMSDAFRRSVRIVRRFDTELSYIEMENGWSGEPVFASQVRVSSDSPILNLEDIEHHLRNVQCSDESIKLHFVDTVSARDAKEACMNEHGGIVVTSHEGCNSDGQRSVYKVHDVQVSADEHSLELSVVESKWKKTFSQFNIEFGYTKNGHLFRRQLGSKRRPGRRQVLDPATITAAPVAIPSDTPDEQIAASFDLSFSTANSTFSPEEFLKGAEGIVAIPDLPVELGCNECTTTGALTLTQGSFDIDLGDVDLLPDFLDGDDANVLSIIKGGFIELAAKDLAAHIDLFAKPKASGEFEIALPSLPIVGFVIPGLGKAGVSFEASLLASFEVEGGIEINYGFDVTVPSDSTIRIDMSDLEKSGITGFDVPELKPLPFTANVTDLEIALGLTFKPSIPIGFDFLDGQLEAEVSVFFELPSLEATFAIKDNVDAQCDALPEGNSTTNLDVNNLLDALGALVLEEATIGIALGVAASFNVPVLPEAIGSFETAFILFETEFALPTTCLAANQAYETATKIWESITKSYVEAHPTAPPLPELKYETNSAVYSYTTPAYESNGDVYTPPAHETSSVVYTPPAHETSSMVYQPYPPAEHESSIMMYPPPAHDTTSIYYSPEHETTTIVYPPYLPLAHETSSVVYTPPPVHETTSIVYIPPPAHETTIIYTPPSVHETTSIVHLPPPVHETSLIYPLPPVYQPSSVIYTPPPIYETSAPPPPPPPPPPPNTSIYIPFPVPENSTTSAFLTSGTGTGVIQPSAPLQATIAAAPGLSVPMMEWGIMWQGLVLGFGAIIGATLFL